jgi:tetratricopeptide (TPR) repeat protein
MRASFRFTTDMTIPRQSILALLLSLMAVCLLLLLSACPFPRILVLKDPLTAEEHLNLGVVYEKNGEYDNAIEQYKLAARELTLAHLHLGNTYFQMNEFDKAERSYKRSIKKNPGNADAYNNLAWLYFVKREHLDEAEALALRAIELDSRKAHIYRDTLEKIRDLGTANR